MSNNIIEVRNLSVSYNNNTILSDVSFDIERGDIFFICGGSGSGKSTLLKQLIGIEEPSTGSIFIDNEELTNSKGEKRKSILRKFGMLFQSSGLFASMTLKENIELLLETHTEFDNDTIRSIVNIKLGSVGLQNFGEFFPAEISGGMKKRAGIARAMTLDPSILFFDEPSSGLDPTTSAALDELIVELNANLKTTMVIVSHDLQSIMSIAKRVVMIDGSVKGIIVDGIPENLKNFNDNKIVYNFFNRHSN